MECHQWSSGIVSMRDVLKSVSVDIELDDVEFGVRGHMTATASSIASTTAPHRRASSSRDRNRCAAASRKVDVVLV